MVVIIGLFLLMFDAEAGLHNPLRFALLLHNPCSVMTWGVVFPGGIRDYRAITLLLDCLKKQVPVWLGNRGLGVCGMRWRIHGRFARRVPDVPAVEQRFAADSILGFGGFHGHVFGAACGRPEVPQRNSIAWGVLKKFHYCFPIVELVLVASLCFITSSNSAAGFRVGDEPRVRQLGGLFWLGFIVVGLVAPTAVETWLCSSRSLALRKPPRRTTLALLPMRACLSAVSCSRFLIVVAALPVALV